MKNFLSMMWLTMICLIVFTTAQEIPAHSRYQIIFETRSVRECAKVRYTVSLKHRDVELAAFDDIRIVCCGSGAPYISTYDTEDPVAVGQQTMYVVEVRNGRINPASGLVLTNTIPANMKLIAVLPVIWEKEAQHKEEVTFEIDRRVIVFSPLLLQPGEKVTYRFLCYAFKEGVARNRASFVYDQWATGILDEEGTTIYR